MVTVEANSRHPSPPPRHAHVRVSALLSSIVVVVVDITIDGGENRAGEGTNGWMEKAAYHLPKAPGPDLRTAARPSLVTSLPSPLRMTSVGIDETWNLAFSAATLRSFIIMKN